MTDLFLLLQIWLFCFKNISSDNDLFVLLAIFLLCQNTLFWCISSVLLEKSLFCFILICSVGKIFDPLQIYLVCDMLICSVSCSIELFSAAIQISNFLQQIELLWNSLSVTNSYDQLVFHEYYYHHKNSTMCKNVDDFSLQSWLKSSRILNYHFLTNLIILYEITFHRYPFYADRNILDVLPLLCCIAGSGSIDVRLCEGCDGIHW